MWSMMSQCHISMPYENTGWMPYRYHFKWKSTSSRNSGSCWLWMTWNYIDEDNSDNQDWNSFKNQINIMSWLFERPTQLHSIFTGMEKPFHFRFQKWDPRHFSTLIRISRREWMSRCLKCSFTILEYLHNWCLCPTTKPIKQLISSTVRFSQNSQHWLVDALCPFPGMTTFVTSPSPRPVRCWNYQGKAIIWSWSQFTKVFQ
jgi:hypothetical protein